ncbi:unnamed protein product [Didymodactylos carnosus]|uniref:Uncharacterized protein n=1 Tax=Didymodactylos carnosus TaxID=1234261 RepID=A0A813UJV7_9BILA|nr:unnamed protein product [Didymodactylos carnosus]CAF0959213.1 unnamed protein product [Didymodactylos carnosus]CAF3611052.1 unnamed protein product [Didymodactylos carnosus]CAF3732027.1 unnamed protein product [Didymodactylos carnosus]
MFQKSAYAPSRPGYVPSLPQRGIYRSSYVRPGYGYRPRFVPPVVPAGRGPGGAGLLAAILGPIGGLTGCLCCLNTIGTWGLFITAIPLAVFISRWYRDFKNYRKATFGNDAEGLFVHQILLCMVLLISLLFGRRMRSI